MGLFESNLNEVKSTKTLVLKSWVIFHMLLWPTASPTKWHLSLCWWRLRFSKHCVSWWDGRMVMAFFAQEGPPPTCMPWTLLATNYFQRSRPRGCGLFLDWPSFHPQGSEQSWSPACSVRSVEMLWTGFCIFVRFMPANVSLCFTEPLLCTERGFISGFWNRQCHLSKSGWWVRDIFFES